jgi:hypothetical protein
MLEHAEEGGKKGKAMIASGFAERSQIDHVEPVEVIERIVGGRKIFPDPCTGLIACAKEIGKEEIEGRGEGSVGRKQCPVRRVASHNGLSGEQ